MVRHYLDQIDHLNATVAMFDVRIAELLAAQERDLDLLDTIPGISRFAAEIVIAETGGDMAQFATAHHLASWIGVCPGQSESAGVNRSGRTRHGNTNLKRLLGVAAMAAVRNKNSYLAVFYRRIASRRGAKRALVAVMHKLGEENLHTGLGDAQSWSSSTRLRSARCSGVSYRGGCGIGLGSIGMILTVRASIATRE
ncbi:transposase [Streptomyces sp. NPDC004393]